MTSTTRRRRLAAGVATAAIAAATVLAAPMTAMAASSDTTDNGGATRNDSDMTQLLRDSLVDGPARNVILIIGDGMGDSEITVARNYAEGAAGEFDGIDALPLTGQYTTYSVNQDGTPNYASESASTASAWSTGTKAVNGQLSIDTDGVAQTTLLELARANGMMTGNVSTAEIQDATPAAQVAHINARGCYGPEQTSARCSAATLENGGLGSIAEQMLSVRPDVTLGGGAATFDQVATAGPWAGQTLLAQAEDRGFQVVEDAAGLADITEASPEQPVLGLFSDGNMPVRYAGPEATVGGGDLPAQSCQPNPERLDPALSLGAMTSRAIDLLDNQDGFFLQVEGGSIDKRDHAADACGQIGETVDLDEAVQAALDYASQRDDTLVVVTADHAHTSQIVGSTPPGLSANLLTEEGQEMIVSYGTAPQGSSQQHTGSQVRVAGYGPGAANVVGLTDQTDLFFTSANALELERDLPTLSSPAALTPSATTVPPGSTVQVAVAGMAGDWQATASVTPGSVTPDAAAPDAAAAAPTAPLLDPSLQDLLRGATTFAVTAPETEGPFTVEVAGAQTGTTRTIELVVAADAVTPPSEVPSPTPVAPAPDAGGAAGGTGGSGGGLPTTGATVAWALLAVAAVLIGLGYRTWRRRTAPIMG